MEGPRKRALRLFTLKVVLLGTAAGGGFPQWNCWCPTCTAARTEPHRACARSQSSVAISADGERWFLLNASPDVHQQLGCLSATPASGVRHVPVEGILLTDAELDHTLGIVLMRESRALQLYLTRAVKSILEVDTRLLPVTRSFADIRVTEVKTGESTELHYRNGESSGIRIKPISVPAGPPR